MSYLTDQEIKEIENKSFNYECDRFRWQRFREIVKGFVENKDTFGKNTDEEWEKLKKELESMRYY